MKRSLLLLALTLISVEAMAQVRRGPHYNPPGGPGPGAGGGQPHMQPRVNPQPQMHPQGPVGPGPGSMNHPRTNGGGGVVVQPRVYPHNGPVNNGGPVLISSQPVRRPPVVNYNPYNNGPMVVRHIPSRNLYGTPGYFRPSMYRPTAYSPYMHSPYNMYGVNQMRNYLHTVNYYNHIRTNYGNYVYLNWLMYPAIGVNNGYNYYDGYPYYVYNGYRHRYSNVDQCNYQLVDKYTNQVIQNYYNQTCSMGYNSCAYQRDSLNSNSYEDRYLCAETYRDQNFDFNTPTYEYGQGYDDNCYGNNGQYNNGQYNNGQYNNGQYNNGNNGQYSNPNGCYDYDYQTGICYDNY